MKVLWIVSIRKEFILRYCSKILFLPLKILLAFSPSSFDNSCCLLSFWDILDRVKWTKQLKYCTFMKFVQPIERCVRNQAIWRNNCYTSRTPYKANIPNGAYILTFELCITHFQLLNRFRRNKVILNIWKNANVQN